MMCSLGFLKLNFVWYIMESIENNLSTHRHKDRNTADFFENGLVTQNMLGKKTNIDAPGPVGGKIYINKGVIVAEQGDLTLPRSNLTPSGNVSAQLNPQLQSFQVSQSTSAPNQIALFRDSLHDFFSEHKKEYNDLLNLELSLNKKNTFLENIMVDTTVDMYQRINIDTNTFKFKFKEEYTNLITLLKDIIAAHFSELNDKMQSFDIKLRTFLEKKWAINIQP